MTKSVTIDAGLLLVDKPAGKTSHEIVAQLRRQLGIRRIGHTGTLDPFATGLLLILVGRATRLAEFYHVLSKTYEATMELGRETDTDDLTGATVTESSGWEGTDGETLRETAAAYVGRLQQTPSTYSAKRIDGRRAYDAARQGETLRLEPVEVTIHDLQILDVDPPRVRFRARVSTGTYIRALARDLGRDLGCGAHLLELRRTAIGPFDVTDGVAAEAAGELDVRSDFWRFGAAALPWLESRQLTPDECTEIRHGRTVALGDIQEGDWAAPSVAPAELPIALVRGDELFAIAERGEDALLPRKVFAS